MLPTLIRSLLDPGAYEHRVDAVELIHTHISWVLLAGDFAYKIKKPVKFGFLDYSTLARRKLMCEREVELNRRSCPDAYLGVVRITGSDEAARFGGSGPAIEYAVKMRRLAEERWLSAAVDRGDASAHQLRQIARSVHDFHHGAIADARTAAFGSSAEVAAIWQENLDEIRPFVGDTLTSRQLADLSEFARSFLASNASLIDARASSGRARDGHGDLRSDSIYLQPGGGVCMCDCIEFSDRLRCGDVAGDAAFLAMDLDFRAREDLADEFAGAYTELASDDETLAYMLPFYRCHRAAVRGKVETILSRDPELDSEQSAEAGTRARRYFALAATHATDRSTPALYLFAGLSGSGKSHLAAALAARIGAVLVRSDAVRRAVFATDEQHLYGTAERGRVYDLARARAAHHLRAGRPVVLDATHMERHERDAGRDLAASLGVPSALIWVSVDETTTRERLSARDAGSDAVSDARWETYLGQRRRADPLTAVERSACLRVDGTATATANIAHIIRAVPS